jgi:hypothetical protein
MAGQFGLRFPLLRKSQGYFTCRKSATWDRRLYFPSEGRHAVDFLNGRLNGFVTFCVETVFYIQQVIAGKVNGGIELTGIRGRRRK